MLASWKKALLRREEAPSRNENHLRAALGRAREKYRTFPKSVPGGSGAKGRMVAIETAPFNNLTTVRVPARFGAFRVRRPSPAVRDYVFAGPTAGVPWRVAVPGRTLPSKVASWLLRTIARHGPQAAGYVRVGDTLVPRRFTPEARRVFARVGLRPV